MNAVKYLLTGIVLLGIAAGAQAASAKTKTKAKIPDPEVSSICLEAETGMVLSEKNADIPRPPASMVKMIQMLLVAEGLDTGKWTLETPLIVTEHAQHMGGTQVYLEKNETWPLGHLMDAVAVASANDAAMAVAEGLWGSEAAYLKAANERAAELGMTNSVFRSVHGLPPEKGEDPDQTTARDMAILGRQCVQHEQILKWVGQKEMKFRPENAVVVNTNKLLWRMPDCDGIKTGYIRAAGFCITATAKRDDIRLISVVMGSTGKYDRFNLAQELLESGFGEVKRVHAVIAGENLGAKIAVSAGESRELQLAAAKDLWVIVRAADADRIKVETTFPPEVEAPVQAQAPLGEVRVALDDAVLAKTSLLSTVEVKRLGWTGSLMRWIGWDD